MSLRPFIVSLLLLSSISAVADTQPSPARRLLITVETRDGNLPADNSQTRTISTDSREGGTQQIQVTEGVPAFIQTGQSVPLTSMGTDAYGRPMAQTEYRDVTQGFYVTANVKNDIVNLAISTKQDRMSDERRDVVEIRRANTQVSGPLGQWITLASFNAQNQTGQQGSTLTYSTQSRKGLSLRVKVDALD